MIGLLIALGLIGLLLSLSQKSDEAKKTAEEEGEEDASRASQSHSRAEREREAKKKQDLANQKKMDDIRKSNTTCAELFLELPRVSLDQLNVLHLAATQEDIRIDLATEVRRTDVSYPTSNVDYVQITRASELPAASVDQMILDDELFYYKFATHELVRPQYYLEKESFKRLYVLLDVSPSMWQGHMGRMRLPNGEEGTREMWAHAVAISLLDDAAKGHAEYYFRSFADGVSRRRDAFTKHDAIALMKRMLTNRDHGDGTDIARALTYAVADIRDKQLEDDRFNHILLITDGEDNRITEEWIKAELNEDIKLHVILIGTHYDITHPLAPYVIAEY